MEIYYNGVTRSEQMIYLFPLVLLESVSSLQLVVADNIYLLCFDHDFHIIAPLLPKVISPFCV